MPDQPTENGIEAFMAELEAEQEVRELIGFEDRRLDEDQFVPTVNVSLPDHDHIKRHLHLPLRRTPRRYIYANVVGFGPPDQDTASSWQVDICKAKPDSTGVGWDFDDPVSSFKLEDEEIVRLMRVLSTHEAATDPGRHVLVPEGSGGEIAELVSGLLDETDLSPQQMASVVQALVQDGSVVSAIADLGESDQALAIAAAANTAHRKTSLEKLRELVEANAEEQAFQELLQKNWWMLGSRFVERIDRRDFTTDEQLDLALVRADGFPEVVELKRPGAQIFNKTRDGDPPKYCMSAAVNSAVNQAAHYISEMQTARNDMVRKYKIDFFRPKALVIIGTLDQDTEDYEHKRQALHQYDDHLHGIRVVTYSEIIRQSERLLELDRSVAGLEADSDDA